MVESELLWLEDVLKKPTKERKRISEELEKEGYAHFEYLYTPPIDRVSFKERPDIDHDKLSSLSTEEKIDALTFSGLTFLYREYESIVIQNAYTGHIYSWFFHVMESLNIRQISAAIFFVNTILDNVIFSAFFISICL